MFWLCQLTCVNNEIIPFFYYFILPLSLLPLFLFYHLCLVLHYSLSLIVKKAILRNHFLSFLYDTELKYAVLLQEYIYIYIYIFCWDTSIVMLTYLLHKYLLLLVHCVHPDGDDLFFFHILFTNKITGINLWAGLSVSRMMTWRLLKECIAHALYYRYSY